MWEQEWLEMDVVLGRELGGPGGVGTEFWRGSEGWIVEAAVWGSWRCGPVYQQWRRRGDVNGEVLSKA